MVKEKDIGVSVIIPTFNRKDLLLQAIESAFNQTYKPYEVIVSDDGSSDGSEELIKKHFPETVYIYHENCGRCCARNIAIRKAKYPLLAFLDDDDMWDKEFLETCVNRMRKGDVIGVFTNYFKLYPSGVTKIGYKEGKNPSVVDLKWIVRGSFIDPSTVMIKKEIVEKVGGFDESLEVTEDWDLWLRVMRYGNFAYVDKKLVIKRMRVDTSIPIKTWRNNCIVIDKFYSSLTEKERSELQPNLNISRLKIYSRYAAARLHNGEMREARQYLRKIMKIKPFCVKAISRYILTFFPLPIARLFDGMYLRQFRNLLKERRIQNENYKRTKVG